MEIASAFLPVVALIGAVATYIHELRINRLEDRLRERKMWDKRNSDPGEYLDADKWQDLSDIVEDMKRR